MRTVDEERSRTDVAGKMIQSDSPFPVRNIVNLPAVAAVAVAGKGSGQMLKRKLQGMTPDVSDGK